MKYPILTELNTSREMIDVFGGYNHNLRIGSGEFYDMKNLTSTHYPVLSPRSPRGVYDPGENAETPTREVLGMINKDALCYVMKNADGEKSTFYINGYPIEFEDNDKLNAEPKTLISMGSYVIIMPDKMYINTKDHSDKGKIEKTFKYSVDMPNSDDLITPTWRDTFVLRLCTIEGEEYEIPDGNSSGTAPEEPEDMELWLDTSSETHVLRRYSKTNSQWVAVPTTYIKMSFPHADVDFTNMFADGDGLILSGFKDITKTMFSDTDRSKYDALHKQLTMFDSTMVAVKVTPKSIIVTGILDNTMEIGVPNIQAKETPITIQRVMPKMDSRLIIEAGNRLWGCNYGVAHNGEVVNEIYCSKLGDFKNWYAFASISTDSYVASVGSDGQFTGAITHRGYPIFFKENCMHKVYGNYPANFQIQTTDCRGVQKGCHGSLAIVNETLYYKSRSSVCAYDGSLPVEISSALGDEAYSDAVAGAIGNKYYISMKDTKDAYHLFVYDTMKGMWHREDETQASCFCNCDGELYYVDTGRIKTVNGTGLVDTAPVQWMAETGIIGTDSPDKKYISRIVMRLSLELGTRLHLQVQYDSSGAWEQMFSMSGTTLKTFSIPVRPKRCDHLRLRFIGEGAAKIFSITKTIEQGSDV